MSKPSPSKSDLKYLFRPNIRLSKLERRRKRRGWALVIGLLLACIQLVLTVLFQITIFRLDILPMKILHREYIKSEYSNLKKNSQY